MKSRVLLLNLIFLCLTCLVQAQPVFIKEIPQNSENFIKANGKVYFFSGNTLWKTDGSTGGTVSVKALGETPQPISESYLIGENLYFYTKETSGKFAIWKTNGTSTGTAKLCSFSRVQLGIVFKNEFYFAADIGTTGFLEYWKVNTSGQCVVVKDISGDSLQTNKFNSAIADNKLYLGGDDEVYFTNGTQSGTDLAFFTGGELRLMIAIDHFIYTYETLQFDELHHRFVKYDPHFAHDLVVSATILDRNFDYTILKLYGFKGEFYFFTRFSQDYLGLWTIKESLSSDGVNVDWEIIPVKEEIQRLSFVEDIFTFENEFAFIVDGEDAMSIHKSDGTSAGTVPIKRFLFTFDNHLFSADHLNNKIFYSDTDSIMGRSSSSPLNDESEDQFFQTSLHKGGDRSVRQIFPGTSFPNTTNITTFGGKIFFTTQLPENTALKKLWTYDPEKPASNTPYFTLVNADTDKDIQWLKEGDIIVKPANMKINIRYNPVGTPGSVVFKLEDVFRRTENGAPYSLAGDFNGNYSPWNEATDGKHKITATPFSLSGGSGTAGPALTVNFHIQTAGVNKVPVVNAGPDQTIILPQDTTILNGTSMDGDPPIFYQWRLLNFSDTSANPGIQEIGNFDAKVFFPKIPGVYKFLLVVEDADGDRGFDSMQVFLQNAPPPTANPRLILVNAATDTDIRDMLNQDTIIYNSSTDKITIRAIPSKAVGSVVFHLDGAHYRTETSAPYALKGDFSGDYTAWPATYGNHTLTATAYTGSGGSGSVVETRTINFLVKESGTTPPPPPPPSNQITLTLINAATDANIRDMLNQDTIIYNSGTDKITIKAIPSKAIGSVVFNLDGAHYRTESVTPYALNGDNNGDYTAWPATYGNHTLTATAYTGSGGSGSVVETRTINFLVKESGVTPPPPPPPSSAQITFTLVNAVTDTDIGPLVNGQTIDLSTLPTNKLNIRANSTMANTKSVVFDFDGKIKFRTESAAPYALHGDNSGNYNEWIPPTGTHTLKATPYTSTGGGGTAGVALSITFNVTNTSTMAASVSMYPNPANERVSISLPDDPSENVLVIIYDEAGNKYYEATSQVASGSNDFGIDLTHLNMIPGIYFVKIISEDNSEQVVKLVKN